MNKYDYLHEAFINNAYRKKAFLLSIFSIVDEKENPKLEKIPYSLMKEGNKAYFFDKNNVKTYIDEYLPNIALFDKDEPMTLKVESPTWNVKEGVTETTVGRFLTNICVLYEAFQDRVPYINGPINGGMIKGHIKDLMVDNYEVSGLEIPSDKASVDQCLKITKQLDYLEGLNHVFVKASSYDLFTIHPDIIKLRDELLAKLEAEGKMDDEIAIAEVIDILVEKDAEVQFNGPSKDLFIIKDYVSNSRKKMFLLFDMIPDFHTGKFTLLRNSLQEGWDFKEFAAYANTSISASFDRGVGTARGGTEFKIAVLLTNAIKGIIGNCGSTRTEPVKINKLNKNGWVSGHYVAKNKSLIQITKDNINDLVGTQVDMRVPQYCKQPDGNLCSVCCGTNLAGLKERVSSEVALIFTVFMLTSMKSMHVSQLNTVEADVSDIVR